MKSRIHMLVIAFLWCGVSGGQTSTVFEKANGALNIMSFGAKCDGATDDTAAFQQASDVAFASVNPSTLVIPATGHSCVISQWNLTNHFGAQKGNNGSIQIVGLSGSSGQQSTIQCKEAAPNSGVCLDLSGSDMVTIDNLRIEGGRSAGDAPKVVLLLARTSNDLGFSNGFYFRNLAIVTHGQFSFYSYGGEIVHCEDCNFNYIGRAGGFGESDVMISAANTRGVTSSFQKLASAPVSMTQVTFDGQSVLTCVRLSGSCVELDNVRGDIFGLSLGGYANLGSDMGRSFLSDLGTRGELHGIRMPALRVEGNNPGHQLAVLHSGAIKAFEVDAAFVDAVAPTKPEIVFSNAEGSVGEGSVINLMPGEAQTTYPGGTSPSTVIRCAGAVWGLVIYDRNKYGGGNMPVNCPGAIQIPGAGGYWSIDGSGNIKTSAGITASSVKQNGAGNFAGSCSMSSSTTCSFALAASFTNYVCFPAIDPVSTPPATAISAKCSVSGKTATITAGATNSLTWDALFVGNPN